MTIDPNSMSYNDPISNILLDCLLSEAYETGVQDSMLRATQIERVLEDLIAVLRDEHRPYQGCAHDCCRECSTCRATWPCETVKELDHCEEWLREVSSDE